MIIKSIKNRLLLWVIIPLLLVSAIALYDTQNYAIITANEIFDQTMAGSAIAIAERVVVTDNGELDVDIPYIALDLLTSAAHDRIFYRINKKNGVFITGYKKLVADGAVKNQISYSRNQDILFYDGQYRGENIRLARFKGVAIGADASHEFEVLLAETTQARNLLTENILFSTGLRLALLLVTAMGFVWVGIVIGLKPLILLQQAISRRNPNDLHPITHIVPMEVETLISGINNFMARLATSLAALRSFTGNAEHQIKTPLSVAKTNIYLAQQTNNIDKKQYYLNVANGAINDCERLLSQLLLLSSVENEAAEKSKVKFNLLAQIKQNIAREYPVGAQFNIDLGLDNKLKNDNAQVIGNATLFDELMHNIIHNIFIHAEHCSIATIYISEDLEAYYVRIEDNGVGVAPNMHQKILSRFGQVDANKSLGSGLGLSIAVEIMHLYGGELELTNAIDSINSFHEKCKGLAVHLKFRKI